MKRLYVVSDTNIFLDLLSIDLLAAFFSLTFDFHTTDFVIAEIKEKHQQKLIAKYIENGKLFIKKFDSEETGEFISFFSNYFNKISIQDCSVWHYAKKTNARLLTGDLRLRKMIEQENAVQVSGIIFLFDEMIKQKIITKKYACTKLIELMGINPRLPNSICNEKIELWRSKDEND